MDPKRFAVHSPREKSVSLGTSWEVAAQRAFPVAEGHAEHMQQWKSKTDPILLQQQDTADFSTEFWENVQVLWDPGQPQMAK